MRRRPGGPAVAVLSGHHRLDAGRRPRTECKNGGAGGSNHADHWVVEGDIALAIDCALTAALGDYMLLIEDRCPGPPQEYSLSSMGSGGDLQRRMCMHAGVIRQCSRAWRAGGWASMASITSIGPAACVQWMVADRSGVWRQAAFEWMVGCRAPRVVPVSFTWFGVSLATVGLLCLAWFCVGAGGGGRCFGGRRVCACVSMCACRVLGPRFVCRSWIGFGLACMCIGLGVRQFLMSDLGGSVSRVLSPGAVAHRKKCIKTTKQVATIQEAITPVANHFKRKPRSTRSNFKDKASAKSFKGKLPSSRARGYAMANGNGLEHIRAFPPHAAKTIFDGTNERCLTS